MRTYALIPRRVSMEPAATHEEGVAALRPA
jgi:hypothetical protein